MDAVRQATCDDPSAYGIGKIQVPSLTTGACAVSLFSDALHPRRWHTPSSAKLRWRG